MKLIKPTYTDRRGVKRRTPRWYLDFVFEDRRHRIPVFTDRKTSEQFKDLVGKLVSYRACGKDPYDHNELGPWLDSMEQRHRDIFLRIGLLEPEPEIMPEQESLEKYLAEYEDWLRSTVTAKGFHRVPRYIRDVVQRIRSTFDALEFKTWQEINAKKIAVYLGTLGVTQYAYNGYVTALKGFTSWVIEDHEDMADPLRRLKRVQLPKGSSRRGLTAQEMNALLLSTEKGPKRLGLSGPERCVIYVVAAECGLRVSELAALRVSSFDLDNRFSPQFLRAGRDNRYPVVRLAAALSKNRMETVVPLKRNRIKQLRAFFASRQPDEIVFNMPSNTKTAKMLRQDVEDADMAPVDPNGKKLVFHSLRHTLGNELDQTTATLKQRMAIIRHSDGKSLTLARYTDTPPESELRNVIEQLPDYPWPACYDVGDTDGQEQERVA